MIPDHVNTAAATATEAWGKNAPFPDVGTRHRARGSAPRQMPPLTYLVAFVTVCNVQKFMERFLFNNNQPDALIIQMYSVIKLYMYSVPS